MRDEENLEGDACHPMDEFNPPESEKIKAKPFKEEKTVLEKPDSIICKVIHCIHIFNSYLFHRIIDCFPRIFKGTIVILKPVLLDPSCRRPGLTKLAIDFMILF